VLVAVASEKVTLNILHIDCSPRVESISRELSGAIVGRLLDIAPDAKVIRRDLGAVPLPAITPDYATTLSSPATLAAPWWGPSVFPKCSSRKSRQPTRS